MKKLLYAVAAFAVLFTSCAKDDAVAPVEDKEALVSFCVNSPAVATRYGEGEEATTLYWAVYNADGSIVEALQGSKEIKLSTTVDLRLIQGRSYDVLFWAADAQAPYEVDWGAKTMTVKDVLTANQESYDAFFKYESLGEVSGALSKTIELRRPFAQLNIATGDTTDAGKAEFVVSKTAVTVENVYKTLSFVDGTVSDEVDVAFTLADKANGTISVGDKSYDHIAMNYLLVGDKKLVNVELTINDEGLTRNYSSVPVQRNYRTNIVGNILTSPAEFNVVILPGFEEETLPSEDDVLDNFIAAAQQGGEIKLTQNITLPATLTITKKLTIDLAGHTISYDKDIYADENGNSVKEAVIINNGVLTITNGTISSLGTNGGSAIMNKGTLTVENATLNGAPNADGKWPSYAVNNTGKMTATNTTITSYHGAVASYGEGAVVTLNNSTIDMAGIPGFTNHGIYTYDGGKVVVNGGTYANNAADQNDTGASVINGNVEVNAGTFSGRIENYYGTPVLKGGIYSAQPAAKYIATGYKAMEKDDKWHVVPADVDAVASNNTELAAAIADNATIMLGEGTFTIPSANGKTLTFVGAGSPEQTVISLSHAGGDGANGVLSTSNVTFENLSITTDGNDFTGYARMNATYKNCVINNTYFLYGESYFYNCVFNDSGNSYNIWTYGAPKAVFEDCVFNCEGKSIYMDGNNTVGTDLTITR